MLVVEEAVGRNVTRPPYRGRGGRFFWSWSRQQPADQLIQLTHMDIGQAQIPQTHTGLRREDRKSSRYLHLSETIIACERL